MTDKNNTKTVRVKEKIKAIYPHIVVGGKIDKPCFSIHWYDVKKKEMYIGYSSYNLNYVREWLKENFEIVEPEIDNLIKRQKAEIEALKELDKRLLKTARLERAEAYKEFAAKIYQAFAIENTRDGYLDCTPNYTRLMECVNNVLKELVGETDD